MNNYFSQAVEAARLPIQVRMIRIGIDKRWWFQIHLIGASGCIETTSLAGARSAYLFLREKVQKCPT